MKKRFTFKCWSCKRTYTLFREITEQQKLIVPCPYCNVEAVVKLEPYKRDVITALKGEIGAEPSLGYEYDFPEVIPTQKPDEDGES